MIKEDILWLAGLLEGEGSFMKGPPSDKNTCIIRVNMTDKDVIEKVAKLFGTKSCFVKSKNNKHKDSWVAKVKGINAFNIMKEIYPYMGIRRKDQIDKALGSYRPKSKQLGFIKVDKIREDIRLGLDINLIAQKYNISTADAYNVKSGRTWSKYQT